MNPAEATCHRIYSETKAFYPQITKGREPDVGFQILYGPPHVAAPILFLGYQPGRGTRTVQEERDYGSEDRWPPICEYATERWPLATCLQTIFGVDLLKRCVGLNAIFIRSTSVANYEKTFNPSTRRKIKDFCRARVVEIIKAVSPNNIVAVGFRTLELFGPTTPELKSPKGRVLTKTGQIANRKATAVIHLTGARISTPDRDALRAHLRVACTSK
jgi:hypothetical protein